MLRGSRLPRWSTARRGGDARLGPWPGIAFALATFLVWCWFARLDFDPHHDGYMLAQAVAISEGLSAHSDVFGQYGPLTPWFQSMALWLPVEPALAIRIANAGLLSLSVYLLTEMGRRRPSGWPVSRAVGWTAAVAWFALCDMWLGYTMLPWPPVLAVCLVLGALLLVTRSVVACETNRPRAAWVLAFLSGALLGVSAFSRINVGIPAILVAVVCSVLWFWTATRAGRVASLLLVAGIATGFGAVVLLLAATGSLNDFWTQAVVWPRTWASRSLEEWSTLSVLRRTFLIQSLPALVLAWGAASIRARVNPDPSHHSRFQRLVPPWPAAAIALVTGAAIVAWELAVPIAQAMLGLASDLSAMRVLEESAGQYLYLFMVIAILGALAVPVVLVWRGVRHLVRGGAAAPLPARFVPWLALAGLTVATLSQVVPTWDVRHVWWGLPLGLLLTFALLDKARALIPVVRNPLLIPLVAVALIVTPLVARNLAAPRVPGPPGTIIEGMLVGDARARAMAEDSRLLSEVLPSSERAVFLVPDGDTAVLGGGYQSVDPFFVDWGPVPSLASRLASRPLIVMSVAPTAQMLEPGGTVVTAEDLQALGYQLVARTDRLAVYRSSE